MKIQTNGELIIPYLPRADGIFPLAELAGELKVAGDPLVLNSTPWPEFSFKPRVEFWAGWGPGEILLHYRVTEDRVKAQWTKTNDPVCRDSCVEFFIDAGEGVYFNFEFNPIGTAFAGVGRGREDRKPVDESAVFRIRRDCSLGGNPFPEKEESAPWTLTAGIPLDIFKGTPLEYPSGRRFGANIYKCGDDLAVPHFVTWQPVGTVQPDFHQPRYFGTVLFEPPR